MSSRQVDWNVLCGGGGQQWWWWWGGERDPESESERTLNTTGHNPRPVLASSPGKCSSTSTLVGWWVWLPSVCLSPSSSTRWPSPQQGRCYVPTTAPSQLRRGSSSHWQAPDSHQPPSALQSLHIATINLFTAASAQPKNVETQNMTLQGVET